jgi:O-acetylserine/cysteine efflux transporter
MAGHTIHLPVGTKAVKPKHVVLAVVVSALWGFNFVAARLALGHLPPLLLAAIRFSVAALPAVVLPRPAVPWPRMLAIASTLFIGQFAFLFCGMQAGMPPGLASVLTQLQAVVTALLAVLVLHETPRGRQVAGLAVTTLGLACIGVTVGTGGVTIAGLLLTLAAAASWAAGNLLLRDAGRTDMLSLVVWLSVIPPVPLLLLSLIFENPALALDAFGPGAWTALLAVLYIVVAATLGGYGLWGYLLKLYPASTVAPFALLVPIFGLISARLTTGERFDGLRVGGILLMCFGLAVANLPLGSWFGHGRRLWPGRRAAS